MLDLEGWGHNLSASSLLCILLVWAVFLDEDFAIGVLDVE